MTNSSLVLVDRVLEQRNTGNSRRQNRMQTDASTGATAVMFLDVAVEVRLLAEASVALRAAERTLAVVDVAHVTLQVGRYAETPSAVLAAIRLFAGVRAQVSGEVGRARESLAAVAARVSVGVRRRRRRRRCTNTKRCRPAGVVWLTMVRRQTEMVDWRRAGCVE